MNVMILGSGGREHSLLWRLAQDDSSERIYTWPGNPGMWFLPKEERSKYRSINIPFNKNNLKEMLEIYRIDLVVPGSETFLYMGIGDWCKEWNVPCFGPDRASAFLEESKLFSKNLMLEAGIPTARFRDLTNAFKHNFESIIKLLLDFEKPVIKISGPSLGKGVFVCNDQAHALETLRKIKGTEIPGLKEGIFVEERVYGREVSCFYACHHEDYTFLGAAQDHKRLSNDDQGPNTGGMGAYSPVDWVDDQFLKIIEKNFLLPTLKILNKKKIPFKGVLFLGFMVNENEVNLLEYNVRFGDPEAQVVLPLITGDLTSLLFSFAKGTSQSLRVGLKKEHAVHVVKAAKGYPSVFADTVEKDQRINVETSFVEDSQVFFAGVRIKDGGLSTSGGRVLGVTGVASNRQQARSNAYLQLSRISFDGEHYRSDIGEIK